MGCSPWGCKESDTIEQLTLLMASTLKEYFDLDLFSVELGWGEGKEDSLVRPKLSLVAWGRGRKSCPRDKVPD